MSGAAAPHASVASSTWKLLWLRVRIWASVLRHATLRRKIGTVVVAALLVGLLVAAFAGSWALLSFLRSPKLAQAVDLTQVLEALPTVILTGAFLTILVTSFGVLLQSLYLARDMDFLMAAPIPVRAVFISKLIQAILPNFALLCLLSLPVLFGLGASAGYHMLFYPLVIMLLVCMTLAAAGLSAVLVMGVVRLVPARRVAEALAAVGAAASLICSQSGNFTRNMTFDARQTTQVMDLLARANAPWSPFAWAGRGLIGLGTGQGASAALGLGLTLVLAVGIFAVALRACEVLYHTGWSQMQAGTQRRPRARPHAAPRATPARRPALPPLLPRAVSALIVKDALVLRRDLRNLSQLMTPLIVGIVYAIMLARSGGQVDPGRGEAPEWFMHSASQMLAYGNIVIALFIGWIMLSRLGMMAFSHEGRAYWLIKTAPVTPVRLMLAKALAAYVPTLVIGEAFLAVASLLQRAGASMMLFGMPVVALALAGAVGVNLAFGVAGANLEWEDPRHMVRGSVGCIGSFAGMAYMALVAAFFIGPAVLVPALGGSVGLGQAIGVVVGGMFALVCALLPPYLMLGRVRRIGEVG
jgi:ABC-2 type transport system permease protein